MDIQQKLDSTVIRVHQSWHFIGRLLARAKIVLTDEMPTAGTDGRQTIMFNPDFIKDKCPEDLVILMAHEIMHIILRHTYGHGRVDYPEIWNVAEDIVVNAMLDEKYLSGDSGSTQLFSKSAVTITGEGIWPSGDSVTFNGITINGIKDKTVRDVYWELLKALSNKPRCGNGKSKGGDGEDDGENPGGYKSMDDHSQLGNSEASDSASQAEEDKIRQDWQRAIMQAAADEAKRKGTLPGSLGDLVAEITEAKIPWRDRLRNAMMSSLITDSRYNRWNKRNCVLGTPIPGYVREGLNVIVHLDTSGSTYGDLGEFLGEIKGIASLVPGSKVTVIQCDSEIQSIDDISADFKEFQAKGFGGTSHAPVIKHINDMDTPPKVFISFTDGYSDISYCYPELRQGITSIICLPKSSETLSDSLSSYGDVLVID